MDKEKRLVIRIKEDGINYQATVQTDLGFMGWVDSTAIGSCYASAYNGHLARESLVSRLCIKVADAIAELNEALYGVPIYLDADGNEIKPSYADYEDDAGDDSDDEDDDWYDEDDEWYETDDDWWNDGVEVIGEDWEDDWFEM